MFCCVILPHCSSYSDLFDQFLFSLFFLYDQFLFKFLIYLITVYYWEMAVLLCVSIHVMTRKIFMIFRIQL